MRFSNVSILSLAHLEAPHRVTSTWIDEQLADTMTRLGLRAGLLEGLSGIVARRFWDEGTMPSDVAAAAAELALDRAALPRERIGICVNTSVCRDWIEPSTACIVHGKLGLPSTAMNFDLGNACLAFMNGMDVVAAMVERGALDYGLIVDGEGSRQVIDATIARLNRPETTEADFRTQFAALTLGSGAAAMILCRTDQHPDRPRYMGSTTVAATEWSHLCRGQTDYMQTDTRTLLEQGLALAQRAWTAAAREHPDWSADAMDELIIHQVSSVHTEMLAELLGLDLDKVLRVYPEHGNMGPAGVPFVLSSALDAGRITKGARLALMGIGSGLNCAMAEVRW
jgi:acyl-CoA:acyl-CoA alkyltransferase